MHLNFSPFTFNALRLLSRKLVVIIIAVLLLLAILFFQPRWLLSLAAKIAPGVVYFSDTYEPVIALTIDDGPDSVSTPQILETLNLHQVHCTFFLISSRVESRKKIVREIVQSGHELGNHLTEDKPSIKLSSADFESALVRADNTLSQFFGQIRWLRPGSGWYNRSIVNIAHKHNYRVALGSIFPYDTHIPFSWFASWQILTNARPGSIIVLHDGGERGKRTVSTLKTILPQLQKKGYRIVSLSELFPSF